MRVELGRKVESGTSFYDPPEWANFLIESAGG